MVKTDQGVKDVVQSDESSALLAPMGNSASLHGGKGDKAYKTDDDDHTDLEESHQSQLLEEMPVVEHLGSNRQYWRDMILGVNDGIISTFLLVTGVAGGGLSSRGILLTAVSGALAGAVSMFAGEYVATKSQNEVMHGEIELEKSHVWMHREQELKELGPLLHLIGITEEQADLRQQLTEYYRSHPHALLKIMCSLEFGVLEDEKRNPLTAGLFSCALFAMGSLPSVLPFLFFGDDPLAGLLAATAGTATALLMVGLLKSWATRGSCVAAALENLLIAGCGGILAYVVGLAFDALIVSTTTAATASAGP